MARVTNEFDHAPGASLDYGFDFAVDGWLDTGETISSSTWTVTAGVTLTNDQIVAGVTSVFVSGGTSGATYYLINTIITDSVPPRTDSRQIVLSCRRR